MLRSGKGSSSDQTERFVSALFDHNRYSTLGSLVKGIIHKNNAARRKGRLMKKLALFTSKSAGEEAPTAKKSSK